MTLRSIVLIAAMVTPRWSHGQVAAGAVVPQSPEITLETQATTAQLERWLHSGEPRLIAWGATLARAHGDAAALADASAILKDWPRDPSTGETSKALEEQDAIAVLLDAMIQLKVPISSSAAVGRVQDQFLAQAVLLVADGPEDVRRDSFSNWLSYPISFGGGVRFEPGRSSGALHRIAAMFEAKQPPPRFAAGVLGDAEEHVSIAIGDEGIKYSRYDRFSDELACGSVSYVPRPVMPGWPVVYWYHLEEEPVTRPLRTPPDAVLIDAGGTRITWRRAGPDDWPGGCGVAPLTARTRHALLAQMLDEPESALQWPVSLNRTIVWHDAQQLQMEIGKIVAGESAKQRQTLLDLMAKGLILPDEMKGAMPKILLDIQYGPTVPAH